MIARLNLFLFLCMECVWGAWTRENTNQSSAREGIIMSGGELYETSVEVFDPLTGVSCPMPALPGARYRHTMDGLVICGGFGVSIEGTTCLSFTSRHWTISHFLVKERGGHSSWQSEHGLVLMGGYDCPDTSAILATSGGLGVPYFDMQYRTKYACSIPDLTGDGVFITGGFSATVSRYGVLGWVEDLPSLVVERSDHGCGSFLSGDGSQVLLVAGGRDEYNNYLTSTEVLTKDSPVWTLTTPLPRAVSFLSGVTAGGRLYMTGGQVLDGGGFYRPRDEILGWLDEEQEWEETGKMKIGRQRHAASTLKMDDPAMEHCV